MTRRHKQREKAFAVLRYDAFQEPASPEVSVTVKEVVLDDELAKTEVERLNKLNVSKNCRYWYVETRLFPEGRSAGVQVT